MQLPSHLQDTASRLLNHPLVEYLLGVIEEQTVEINNLKAEIRLLKGHSAKPVIPPNSNLEGINSQSEEEVKKNFFYQTKKETYPYHYSHRTHQSNRCSRRINL